MTENRGKEVPTVEIYPVLNVYREAAEMCKDITDNSSDESKAAANRACGQAFNALDDTWLNACEGWYKAGCRLISGQKYRQCTCKIPFRNGDAIWDDILRSFHECAANLWAELGRTGGGPAPTIDLEQSWSTYDEALQEAQERRDSGYSHHHVGAGTSNEESNQNGAGSSRGVKRKHRAGPGSPPESSAHGNLRKPFPCPECPRSYGSKRNLSHHMKSHTTDETTCRDCNYVFASKGVLRTHIESVHRGPPRPERAPRVRPVIRDPESGPYRCGACGKPYACLGTLRDHEVSHTTLDTHCFKCKTTLASKQGYKVHMLNSHPEDAVAVEAAERKRYEEENPEECDVCHKRYKNVRGLQQHKLFHDGKTRCDQCNAVFKHRSSLYAHKAKAHPKKKES